MATVPRVTPGGAACLLLLSMLAAGAVAQPSLPPFRPLPPLPPVRPLPPLPPIPGSLPSLQQIRDSAFLATVNSRFGLATLRLFGVNVCGRLNGGCHSQANCTITTTGRVCACKAGFTGSGLTCTGVNACATNNGGCSPDATCTNTTTSVGRPINVTTSVGWPINVTCTCNAGYSGNGTACADVNECATNNGGCSPYATCTNTPGNRTCACNADYSGNGVTCTYDNACATSNGGCSPDASCTNVGGGATTCTCFVGYSGNGKSCTACNNNVVSQGGCQFVVGGSTVGAAPWSGKPNNVCNMGGGAFVYTFTPTQTITMYANTEGTSFDAVLTVYANGNYVACDADLTPGTMDSCTVQLTVTAGTTYTFVVNGVVRGVGSQPPPEGTVQLTLAKVV